jgi:glycosyltransferase involved in cell wall biosynthesis
MIEEMDEDRKLVIAFDAKRLFNNHTGLGNFSRTLVRDLQRFYPQHDYHLFAANTPRNIETELFFDKDKFTIHRPSWPMPFWRSIGMSSAINALKPDIFHGLSHELPFGLDPKIRTVLSFHDLIYEKYPKQFGWINSRLYKYKYRSSVRRADRVVAISNSTKSDLIEMYHCAEEKLSVIYQSCNDIFRSENLEEATVQVKLPNQPYFLYVGSIIERKGLLQTMIAYGHLPPEYQKPFVVVGGGNKDYIAKVKQMVNYYKVSNKVLFVKGLLNSDLLSVYDRSFALVFPSIYEGFGIPVIESLYRSKPVITSKISSLPEAAGPGAILVDPYDYNSIGQAMIDIQDNQRYKSLAIDGYRYVNDKFDPQLLFEQWMDLYESTVDKEFY